MKIFKMGVIILFCITFVVFGVVFIVSSLSNDNSYPEITIENDSIELSVKDDETKLLQGVTAYDKKDGDLTDKIIVESISRFISGATCKVTYTVCDSDNHVSSAFRQITYTDYVPTRIWLKDSLCFSQLQSVKLMDYITATDVIDGDISDNIIITASDFQDKTIGNYTLSLQVTNSVGDTVTRQFPVSVEERSLYAPVIKLSTYVLYTKVGQKINVNNYIDGVYTYQGDKTDLNVTVESDININKPGVYQAHYYATDNLGRTGHSILIMNVDE